jgi:hypothetical protein
MGLDVPALLQMRNLFPMSFHISRKTNHLIVFALQRLLSFYQEFA